MVKIENSLGKRIQVTNSEVYASLRNKIDTDTEMTYDDLLFAVGNLSNSLAHQVDGDVSKIRFYVSLYGLGCIDGGRPALSYFNEGLDDDEKIDSREIFLLNLKKVFPDMELTFTTEEVSEFMQLFSEQSDVKESQIIRIAYYLKYIAANYERMGKFSDAQGTDFVFDEMEKIAEAYKKTGKLEFTEEMIKRIADLRNQVGTLSNDYRNALYELKQSYMNKKARKEAVEGLSSFRLEKKTKVR